jgi:hypothetical protein
VAGCVVEYKEALGPAIGETFKNVNGLVDLSEKIVRVEITIAVFARLKYNSGFPGGCEDM